MMGERDAMMAKMRADAQKLADLVAKMNTAKSQDKVDAIAAALTELIAQHTAMHERMTSMGGGMMGREEPAGATQTKPPDPHH